jgi:hypothetical protein
MYLEERTRCRRERQHAPSGYGSSAVTPPVRRGHHCPRVETSPEEHRAHMSRAGSTRQVCPTSKRSSYAIKKLSANSAHHSSPSVPRTRQ